MYLQSVKPVTFIYKNIFQTLRENYPNMEFFQSSISRIWTEYGDLLRTSLYSVQNGKIRPEKLRF